MFTIIKRDQEVFRDLIKELTQDGLSLEGAVVRAAKKLGRSESMVLRVYLEYRAKAALLRDEETNADQLERTLKQLDRRQSISGNNLDALRKLVTEAKAQSPPIVGKDGGLAMVSAPRPPVCRNWEDVLTWFAHALQNMKRYHNGHPPLPWRHSPSP
jgi:hypothetical protein